MQRTEARSLVSAETKAAIEQLIVEAEHAGERIALTNIQAMYYGSTFNDTTDWRAEYQQIIEIVDGRLAQLNHLPDTRKMREQHI